MVSETILIIDDEKIALKNLEHILEKDNYKVVSINNPKKALSFLEKTEPSLVITDLKMPEIDGITILKKTKELYPHTEVILITGYASVDTAVEAMKIGAYNYIEKPYKINKVRNIIKEALRKRNLILENIKLKHELSKESILQKIKGESIQIKNIIKTVKQIAPTDTNVLITGESGTGKELIAKAIHELSNRRDHPFIAFNCGSFTEELIANELFGHEKGAFTGANREKKGLIEEANNGTLFLDEIGDMPLSQQVKLLRVIQEKELLRVGGTKTIKINVRFIAATHRNLQEEIEQGNFRQDLFFRLNVIAINLPPLRERKEDIPILANYFLAQKSKEQKKDIKGFTPDTMKFLKNYSWPGNIRELENVIERMVTLTQKELLTPEDLPSYLKGMDIVIYNKEFSDIPSLEEVEKKYIYWVLEQCNFNKSKAAKLIGIDRVSLWRKLKKYNLES